MRRTIPSVLGLAIALLAPPVGAVTVFETDFESGVPSEVTAPGAALEPVQGWDGLGTPGNHFGGDFLRYASTDVVDTTLTLAGLPPHDVLSLGFLLAVIDSWDGVELLEVTIDGTLVFSNTFLLATGDESSYVPPPGGLLSSGTNLGFSSGAYYDHDRAYDLSLEPAFVVPHTSDSVTIVWRLNAVPGGGASFWQGDGDESWAIDNVRVDVETTATTTTTNTTTPTTTTTTTLPGAARFPDARKLLVTRRASGETRLQLLAKGPEVAVDQPCATDGLLVIETGGTSTPLVLAGDLWRPIKAKKPEKGCKYRKGPVVATVQVKSGKSLKVVASGADLGIPLETDPRPVRIELRHGGVRHCVEFGPGAKGTFKAGKKLLAKRAGRTTTCPGAASPNGAFLD